MPLSVRHQRWEDADVELLAEWSHLVTQLDAWAASASEVAPGRIAVTMPDGRVIDLALTPEEFDDLAVAFGRARGSTSSSSRLKFYRVMQPAWSTGSTG
jgi:hypothetical protein